MSNEWVANKGQLVQIILNAIACIIAGFRAWPDMRSSDLLSGGALLFYFLIALMLIAVGLSVGVRWFYLLVAIILLVIGLLIGSFRGSRNLRRLRSEIDRLNPYRLLAVIQLAKRGAMTGEHFADDMQAWGFPIATRAHQRDIGAVFDVINQETTLLTRDSQNAWDLRDREGVEAILRHRRIIR